jgi:hypothetical protein
MRPEKNHSQKNKRQTTYTPEEEFSGPIDRSKSDGQYEVFTDFNVGEPLLREIVSFEWVDQPAWASKLYVNENPHNFFPVRIQFHLNTKLMKQSKAGEILVYKESIAVVLDNDQVCYVTFVTMIFDGKETSQVPVLKPIMAIVLLFLIEYSAGTQLTIVPDANIRAILSGIMILTFFVFLREMTNIINPNKKPVEYKYTLVPPEEKTE